MACDLTRELKEEAARLGFDRVGVAAAVAPGSFPKYLEWLQKGHAAGMGYLERNGPARVHPSSILEDVRTVVMTSTVYGRADPSPLGPAAGRVARYARGADYHEVLWRRLETLLAWLQERRPEAKGRAVADTAPLLERDFARLAGIGWVGKNTMLIDRKLGSFTVLGALLLDIELESDGPHATSHCGTCTRCLDSCPTGAFPEPYTLDASKCVSYWTIEHRGTIPEEYAERLEGWVFGCDVCQDVCPWNHKAPPGRDPALDAAPGMTSPDLIAWLDLPALEFSRRFKRTALWRAKRSGLLRNAALILGQRRVESAVPSLIDRLGDADPVIRGAAAWALRRIGGLEATRALQQHAALSTTE